MFVLIVVGIVVGGRLLVVVVVVVILQLSAHGERGNRQARTYDYNDVIYTPALMCMLFDCG